MADRVALMRAGKLIQLGRPTDLYFSPKDAFVAGFFGDINRLQGFINNGRVPTPFGDLAADGLPDGQAVDVLIRPEAIRLELLPDQMTAPPGCARVLASRMLGRTSLIHLSVDGTSGEDLHLHARIPGRFLPPEDQRMTMHLDHGQAFVFPRQETPKG